MTRFAPIALALALPVAAVAQDRPVAIAISFDADTAEQLQIMGEWVVVSAFYFGDPAFDDVPVDELGQVFLGSEEITIFPQSQTVTLGGGLAGAPFDWAVDARINVNVFTARFTDDFNLIDCGLVEDSVAVVSASVQQISCTMLR